MVRRLIEVLFGLCVLPTLLCLSLVAQGGNDDLADFDADIFLANGPHQQGTVKIDRSKIQTVVTWCSPTLLQMR